MPNSFLGPNMTGPPIRKDDYIYRIKRGVRPYGGRLLYPEYEEKDRVGGRIKGVTATRWYDRAELETL
jgi:hypothetical protein